MNFTIYQIKIALLVFLAIYAVFGVVIIIISQTTRASLESAIDDHDINIDTASLITTIDVSLHGRWLLLTSYWIWGIIILIYSCYGAVAVILESPAHIKVFAFLLLIIASMKVPIIAYTMHIAQSQSEITLKYTTDDLWSTFTRNDEKSIIARDFVQEYHECCGVNGYKDYSELKMNNLEYPKSCCYTGSACTSSSSVYPVGCAEMVAHAYWSCYSNIAGMSIFIIILEILATMLAFYFPRLIVRRKQLLRRAPQA
ncbi:Tetraspanin family [Popillia japonica]|uniref:Tetraspanin family n=1 Tax=Popillia japonica TaxID=7064 RepID=A0AAW1JIF2_POPJA